MARWPRKGNVPQPHGSRNGDRPLTVPEIAEQLGVSKQMVDAYIHRTVRKLWRDQAFRRRALKDHLCDCLPVHLSDYHD